MEDKTHGDPSYLWTAEEIEERLGSSTIVFPRDRLLQAEDIAKMREVGITRIEVCATGNPGHLDIHNRGHVAEVVSECESQGVTIESMHSVDGQRKCPAKWPAKMSLVLLAMITDGSYSTRSRFMGGLRASMYFFAVSRWMPSSRATPRVDNPLRFAF